MVDSIPQKRCTLCKQEFPATLKFFYSHKQCKYGLNSRCKKCFEIPAPKPIVPEGYKRCTKCNKDLPATSEYFPISKQGKGGLDSRCKGCRYLAHRARVEKDPEAHRIEALAIQFRYSRTEKGRQHNLEYDRKHREKRNREHRAYRAARSDARKQEVTQYNQQYRQSHPEQFRARSHKRRALQMGSEGYYTVQDIQKQYQRQHGKCYYCKKQFGKKYQIDHVIPLSKGGTNWPSNLVLACPFCNQSKKDKLLHEWFEGGRLL